MLVYDFAIVIDLIVQKTTIGNKTFCFMDVNDFPHGIFWQTLDEAGTNLQLLEKQLKGQLIYIKSAKKEAHEALAEVKDKQLFNSMKIQMDTGNYVYAIWLLKNSIETNK